MKFCKILQKFKITLIPILTANGTDQPFIHLNTGYLDQLIGFNPAPFSTVSAHLNDVPTCYSDSLLIEFFFLQRHNKPNKYFCESVLARNNKEFVQKLAVE